jgi:F0F1-type ATP synthase membrane subunit b/b'
MDGEVIAVVLIFGSGMWFVLRPLAAAIARRIAGDVPARRDEKAATAALTEVHDELASLREEVAELAERVDFTERLLAKQQDAVRLERPR